MVSSRLRLLCSGIFLPIILVGCGDAPSNIGLGLVDVQAGEPFVVSLEPTSFETSSEADITGGFLTITNSIQRAGATRFLVGSTFDPALGTLAAEGRLNFVTLEAATDAFRNGQVSSAVLTMDLDYAYGDTLTPLTLRLSSILDDWSAAGVRSDTVMSIGEPIMEIEVDPTADLLEIELPGSWVSANNVLLRSESFSSDFRGFHLSQIDGNVVVGFAAASSFLRIAAAADTLRVDVDKVLTAIKRDASVTPAEFLLLQDGVDIIDVVHDFDTDEIINSSIHLAIFRLNTTLPSLVTPVGYYRPLLESVSLVAITGNEESRTVLDERDVDDDGILSFQSTNLNVAMQNTVLGRGDLVRFELQAPIEDNSLNVLFFERTPEAGGPRLLLTVTEVRQ
ncbi:MAG: hypothetical protein BMS9Abin05_0299 [Rhodothermia bacterium]|nr:MAG: hypothetical protein BMS9Abin05_0299 [Rhodothermia bacterium]